MLIVKGKNTSLVLEIISIVPWKPIPVDDPRATMLCYATLVYGELGL